jgi:hypothetical protein
MRVTNKQVRTQVQQLKPFTSTTGYLFSIRRDNRYIVYSYGSHFPLFIYEGGAWYANADKYSVTTNRHYSHAHPHCDPAPMPMTTENMRILAEHGIAGVAVQI